MIEKQMSLDNLVFKCRSGSMVYGTNLPESDIDERGIFIASPEYLLGQFKNIEQVEHKTNGEDYVIYELSKFVKLAAQCNPNIIELLFTPEEHILFKDEVFDDILSDRHLFLSKRCRFTYSGYAFAQLKRVKGHNKWINNPQPEQQPSILNYCSFIGNDGHKEEKQNVLKSLKNTFLVRESNCLFSVYRSSSSFDKPSISEDGKNFMHVDISDEKIIQLMNNKEIYYLGYLQYNEEHYKKDHTAWKQYWEWKKNRNPSRSILEEQHGVDTKHCSHLIRLMESCEEILETGTLSVKRPNADYLKSVRNGQITYDEIIKFAEEKEKKIEELYEKSSLPHSVNIEEIHRIYMRVVKRFLNKKYPGWYYP